jgi:hypothetical protein
MTIISRGALAGLVASIALAACSRSEHQVATPCVTAADCPADARCTDALCVEDAPPVAWLGGVASTVEAFALVRLDGTASSDPDAGDAVQSWAWSIVALDAPCEPPTLAGTSATVPVRFGCAGRYEVRLVVYDALGVASAPASQPVEVIASSAPPAVVAAADVTTAHRCGGTPLACTTFDGASAAPVTLALTTFPTGDGISLGWKVTPPPGRELDAGRRVRFVPDTAAPTASVWIETDGTAISGDWVFTAEARDAAGVVGSAAVRVSVTNEAPVVLIDAPEPLHVHHSFDGATSRFLAEGSVPVSVVDPDGDPIAERAVTWHHANDGGSVFAGTDEGDAIAFQVAVSYGTPVDTLLLMGGEGLTRELELAVADVNGASARDVRSLVIGNRAPVEGYGFASVDHSFDAQGSRYVARAELPGFVDPDGDPLVQDGTTIDPLCSVGYGGGKAIVECALAYEGAVALANFLGEHRVRLAPADPWVAAPVTTAAIAVKNRPPTVGGFSRHAVVACGPVSQTDCCEFNMEPPHGCIWYSRPYGSGVVTLPVQPADPDGDPVSLEFPHGSTPQAVTCLPGACPEVDVVTPAQSLCEPDITMTYVTVRDGGGAAVKGELNLTYGCGG